MAIPIAQTGAPQQTSGPQPATRTPPPAPETRAKANEAEEETPETTVDVEAVASAVESQAVETISGGRTIEFSFDTDINRVIVKVKSEESGEVVRQIPPDEYMRFVARFKEMAGILFDEKA